MKLLFFFVSISVHCIYIICSCVQVHSCVCLCMIKIPNMDIFLFTIFIIYFIAFHFNFFHTGLKDPEASWVGNPSCPVIPNDHSVCLPRIGAAGCTTTPTILHEFWTPEFKSSCLYYNYFANWAISSAFYFLLVCEYCME